MTRISEPLNASSTFSPSAPSLSKTILPLALCLSLIASGNGSPEATEGDAPIIIIPPGGNSMPTWAIITIATVAGSVCLAALGIVGYVSYRRRLCCSNFDKV